MNHLFDLYRKLPFGVKRALKYGYSLIPLNYRLGKRFFKQLDFLEQSQWWSRQELENYQNEQLRMLIEHAYTNVPYYNRIFKDSKLAPSDIQTIHDLHKIPLLTKDIVRDRLDDFIAGNYKKGQLIHITTSGTSGEILDIYCDPITEFINGGPFEWRFYRWGGWNFDDICAVFKAGYFGRKKSGTKQIFEYNPIQKRVFFSIYDLEERNLEYYLDGFQKFSITVLHGYPTWIEKLVDILLANQIQKPFTPKAIFTISELLLPEYREKIESYFESKIYDWYGMQERTVIGCECEKHDGHHINSEFGIVEFIENSSGDKKGDLEIVATGLMNYAMPFIRYKTGDYATSIQKNCVCKRGLPLMKLLGGRGRNAIIDKQGNTRYVIGILDKFSEFLSQYQFVQKDKGKIEVRIIPKKCFDSKEEKAFDEVLKAECGENFEFSVIRVEKIRPTPNGKIPLVVTEK